MSETEVSRDAETGPGSLYGGGGSGGHSHNTATTSAGGNGAKGIVFITEFCTA